MRELTFPVRDFFPQHIFECGQCFRWNLQEDGSYIGIASGRIARVAYLPDPQDPFRGTLQISGPGADDRDFWTRYFDLDRDYGRIKEDLSSQDPVLDRAVGFGWGLRMLRQDPWETMVSFILSSNNNIPRIKTCVEALAKNHGSLAGEWQGKAYYNLPDCKTLALCTKDDLADCRLGYRAGYLVEMAKQVQEKGLLDREEAGLPQLSEGLEGLCGVGPKVASCIRLFSLDQFEAFPVDVWVRTLMNQLYGFQPKDISGMENFAKERFGPVAGIAQQYLFYHTRSGAQPSKGAPEPEQ